LNPRVLGPTRVVAPSSSHIEKLVIQYAWGLEKDLKILPPNAQREFRKSRIKEVVEKSVQGCSEDIIDVSLLEENN
jgi:hypothetical protein